MNTKIDRIYIEGGNTVAYKDDVPADAELYEGATLKNDFMILKTLYGFQLDIIWRICNKLLPPTIQ